MSRVPRSPACNIVNTDNCQFFTALSHAGDKETSRKPAKAGSSSKKAGTVFL